MIDEVILKAESGPGGNGAILFRREKYIPRGGPSGGDGGNGGAVYLEVGGSSSGLERYRYKQLFLGEQGGDGEARNRTGRNGKDLILSVPAGTEAVFHFDEEQVESRRIDLVEEGTMVLVAKGGRGGRGNKRFATATNQMPLLGESGESGRKVSIGLRLMLLADVGVVGKPNVGKSSLLRAVSRATPRVAPYPFTTIEPELAIIDNGTYRFLLAEVPGLVPGAHEGIGLGDKFLRHAERAGILVHLLDGASEDIENDYREVQAEIKAYGPTLAKKRQIVVVNKIDLPLVESRRRDIQETVRRFGRGIFISAHTGEGVQELMEILAKELGSRAMIPPRKKRMETRVIELPGRRPSLQPQVWRDGDNGIRIRWTPLERLVYRADFEDNQVVAQVKLELRRIGLERTLEGMGIRHGEKLSIGEQVMEWR